MTLLAALRVGGSPDPWRSIGLAIPAGVTEVVAAGVQLQFVGGESGLRGWGLADLPAASDGGSLSDIDGVPTWGAPMADGIESDHSLCVCGMDHVVVNTSSLDRTCGAIAAATRAPLKRVRELGAIRRGFHRWGPVIVEVVESPQVTSSTASLWGLVWVVRDLPGVCERLGADVITPPKDAVQPGRQIASFRSDAGLGVPVALMSPDPRHA